MAGEISDEQFFNALAKYLPDAKLKEILSVCGNVEIIKKQKIREKISKEKFILKFQSKSQLLQTVATASKTLEEIKKKYSPINNLPDNILVIIFSKLSLKDKLNFELVCKRWMKISIIGWLKINKLDLREFDTKDNLTKREIHEIFERCGNFLKDLSITLQENNIQFLPIMIKYCNLNDLEIFCVKYTREIFENFGNYNYKLSIIFSQCKNLKSFAIEGDFDGFDYSCLKSLPSNLLTLKLSECVKNEENIFSVDLSKFVNLHELDLSTVLTNADEVKSFENLKNLVKLKLYWRDINDKYSSQVKLFTNLEELDLRAWESSMSDTELSIIAKNCNKLKLWKINYLSHVDGKCLKDIGKMSNLEFLSFHNMTSLTDSAFGNLINVKKLHCVACKLIKDPGIIRLLKRSRNLKEIKLLGTSITTGFYGKANTALKFHKNTILSLTVPRIDENINPNDFPHLKIKSQWPLIELVPSISRVS